MPDREKVIKAYEDFVNGYECFCTSDDYEYEMHKAVLVLLKEQQQIVLCKDCRYWQDNNNGYPHPDCRWGHDETPDPDDYCSFGKRKEGR